MTLIFSGNDFKYELEGVMKLFIPKKLFRHEFTDTYVKAEGDYAYFRSKAGKRYTLLYVYVQYKGNTCHKVKRIDNNTYDYKNECELVLSRLLFQAMSKLTSKQAKWGIITGIRPVKRVNKLLSEEKTEAEIYSIMKSRYLCSDEKIDIACKTAITQSEILSQLDDKSFSLYISIPFCPTRCSYCSFVSQSIEGCMDLIPEYVDNLCKEIEYTSAIVKKLGLKLDTIYFGGGTPTTLEASLLEKIMRKIYDCFDMSNLREYTVEAGRADTITKEKLLVLKQNGCDRISINPQTLNDNVLKEIGRKHTVKQFYDSFNIAKSVGFK
ncbi:MAG: radical SAM protein, partial [Ruminococcus sp.]|nr:radical SAM protein [Ruminococcus sp.]